MTTDRDTTPPDTERDAAPELPTMAKGLTPPPQQEETNAAQEFATIVGNMLEEKLRPVLANQELTLGEVRKLSERVGTIEKRMHIGEGRFERIEREIQDLRGKFESLKRSVDPLLPDGK